MLKDEAFNAQVEQEVAASNWFCPLTKDSCNPKCYCYIPSKLTETDDKMDDNRFGYTSAYCDTYMLTGQNSL